MIQKLPLNGVYQTRAIQARIIRRVYRVRLSSLGGDYA